MVHSQKLTIEPILILPLIALVAACGTFNVTIERPPEVSTPHPSSTLPRVFSEITPTEPVRTDWIHYVASSHYEISYPQSAYSTRMCENNLDALWPGVICIEPNSSFNNRQPLAVTYRIQIAIVEKPVAVSLDNPASLFLNAPLGNSLYPDNYFTDNAPQNTTLNGELAYVLYDINAGLAGIQRHIVTIHDDKLYEFLVLPVQVSGDRLTNVPIVEEILSTFIFLDLPVPTQQSSLNLDCSPGPILKEVGGYRQLLGANDIAIVGNYAYVTSKVGLSIVDVSNPKVPALVYSFLPSEIMLHIAIGEDYAFVASPSRLYMLDITNPTAPRTAKEFDIENIDEMQVQDQRLYTRDGDGILFVYDILNPADLSEIFVYDPPGEIYSGEIGGNHISVIRQNARENLLPSFSFTQEGVYLSDLDGGLHYIDMRGPFRIDTTIPIDLPFIPSDTFIVENRLYIVSFEELMNGADKELWAMDLLKSNFEAEARSIGPLQLPNGSNPDALCSFIVDFYRLVGSDQPRALISLPMIVSLLHGAVAETKYLYFADRAVGLRVFEIN